MDLDAFPVDDESFRARQSECVDMSLIRLGLALRECGLELDEAALAPLPTALADKLLRRVEAARTREATALRSSQGVAAQLALARGGLEGLVEATERARGEAAALSERITAARATHRREERIEAERHRERQREVQDICRQVERKELELRRETMELERLSKMLKKVRK